MLQKRKNKKIPNAGESGTKKVEELLSQTNINSTYLPKSILLEDLDRGIYNFTKDEKIKLVIDGKEVPVIFLTQERWSEFEKTWKLNDVDGNATMPFITVRRLDAPRAGTNPITKYGIPDRKTFQYIKVPTFDNGVVGVDIYKIPQPVGVDIDYEVRLFTHFMVDINKFNETIQKLFYSRQAYTLIKGHYIPIIFDSISDESTQDQIDGQRYYNQAAKFTMLGYLQDENEFEVVKGARRTLLFGLTNGELTSINEEQTLTSFSNPIRVNSNSSNTLTPTSIQNGINTFTGGTSLLPTVNVTGLTIDNLSVTGSSPVNIINLSVSRISGTTIVSGTSDLYSIFQKIGGSSSGGANIINGINTFTGGTSAATSVNITGLTIDNLNVTGNTITNVINFSGGTISGGTISSGNTNLYGIFQQKTGYLLQKAGTISGSTFSGTPQVSTVTFTVPFTSNNYAISIIGTLNRTWQVDNKTVSGFTINANSNTTFITDNVFWTAIEVGEGFR